MSAYSEKLKDPRWQKKRLEILNRDTWKCRRCMTATKTLHIHHIDYIKGMQPWEYDDKYLMTLCEDCHSEISEELPNLEKQIISELRLALKFPLFFQFAIQVLQEYDDDLLYLLFENL